MKIDIATWTEVSRLFDKLVEMTGEQRAEHLHSMQLDPLVTDWLKRLLDASDGADSGILDQTVDELAAELLGSEDPDGGAAGMPDPGQVLDRWRLLAPLGEGAMAVVHLGERADGAYEQRVAIKVLKPGRFAGARRQQTDRELDVLARLEHPNIARLIDGGIGDQGRPYLVMEYVEGMQIDEWCRAQRPGLRELLRLFLKVCDAVQFAHSRLVIHADVKPSNVLVNTDGEPKLVDFGISRLFTADTDQADTPAGVLLRCSPAYAAPEQLRGEAPTTACDVFGLGAVLYELLTGCRVRDGRRVTTLLFDHSDPDKIDPPSNKDDTPFARGALKGDLDAICAMALAADPAKRYRDVAELRRDIENHLGSMPVRAVQGGTAYRLSRWFQRNRLVAGSGALVFASLLAGLLISAHQTSIAHQNAERARIVQDFLMQIFSAADPVANQQNPITVNHLLREQQNQLEMNRGIVPETLQRLQATLADLQASLGNHEDALQLYQQLLAALPDSPDSVEQRADLLVKIAIQFERLGRLDDAQDHAARALELVPLAREFPPVALKAQRTMASILNEKRDNEAAKALLEDVLPYRERILSMEGGPALLGGILADLAEKYGMLGEYDRALATMNDARELLDQAYPRLHPESAQLLAREAGIHRGVGNFRLAAVASFRSATAARTLFGADHTQSIRADTGLAVDLAYLKCYQQAIDLYQQTMSRYRSVFGPNNLMYANALLNLASMRRKIQDYDNALEDIETTLEIYASHGSESTDMQGFALSIKAQLLFELGRTEDAWVTNQQALELMQARLGKDHPQALRVLVSQGQLAHKSGRLEPARSLLEEAYRSLRARVGESSEFTRDAANKLAAVYRDAGDEQALSELTQEAGISMETLPAGDEPTTAAPACELPREIDLAALTQ